MSKSLEGLVFGVQPMDPATVKGVIVMLLGVSMAACYVPAWRATRIAPTHGPAERVKANESLIA